MYEYACHEDNIDMYGILTGARANDHKTAEAPPKNRRKIDFPAQKKTPPLCGKRNGGGGEEAQSPGSHKGENETNRKIKKILKSKKKRKKIKQKYGKRVKVLAPTTANEGMG